MFQREKRTPIKHLLEDEKISAARRLNNESARRYRARKNKEEDEMMKLINENEKRIAHLEKLAGDLATLLED